MLSICSILRELVNKSAVLDLLIMPTYGMVNLSTQFVVDYCCCLSAYSDTLKEGLKSERDYDHISKSAWDKLVARHGLSEGSKPIVR